MKSFRLSSLGLKVLAAYVAGALLSIALAVAAAVWVVRNDVLADLELNERAGALAKRIVFDTNGRPFELDAREVDLGWLYESLPLEAAYRILDAEGNVVVVSKAGEAFWRLDTGEDRLQRGTFFFNRDGVSMYGATEPIEHDGQWWYLQFATSERLMKLVQHKFALPYMGTGIGIFSAILIVAFGLCAYLTLRYALKPLQEISEAAAAISPRSLHARLRTEAVPAEISPLVDSFNRALERLDQGYRVQKEFLGNAAHELKTPLALIRAQVELMEDGEDHVSLLNDVEHMTRQVQQLLLLAEASEVQSYSFADLDVAEVAKEAVSYLQRKADTAGVRLATSVAGSGVRWLADRGALFTLLKNLLENAIEHSPRGTDVLMEVSSTTISVRDQGPGVSEEQLARIFARFWRGAHRRDHGAGLGLAICQEIALAHGWRLSAHRANPGLRLCVAGSSGGIHVQLPPAHVLSQDGLPGSA